MRILDTTVWNRFCWPVEGNGIAFPLFRTLNPFDSNLSSSNLQTLTFTGKYPNILKMFRPLARVENLPARPTVSMKKKPSVLYGRCLTSIKRVTAQEDLFSFPNHWFISRRNFLKQKVMKNSLITSAISQVKKAPHTLFLTAVKQQRYLNAAV